MNGLRLFVYLLFMPGILLAQDQDFGTWLSAEVNHKITSRWQLSLAGQVRLNRNLETVDLCFTQIGAQFTVARNFKAAVNYRLIQKNELDYWSTRHGFFADLAWKKKWKPISLTVRGRLQGRVEDQFIEENGFSPNWFFRTKFSLSYDTERRWTPFVSQETFLLLRSSEEPYRNGDVTRFRYDAGIEYEIDRRNSLSVSYMLQHNRSPIVNEFIVSAGYSFSF